MSESHIVSIVVNTYNRAEFLRRAIDSALAQSYGNCEVIVIDDGSSDHTSEVAREYACFGVKYFYRENQGLPIARNAGIVAAGGEVTHPFRTVG